MPTYNAIRVNQRPGAPVFYLLAVPAGDLLEWADVPRKQSDYLVGYQRELGDRHEKITKYLTLHAGNIVPGSIIVATRPGAVKVTGKGEVVSLEIEELDTPRSDQQRLKAAYEELARRLPASELKAIETGKYDAPEPESQDEDEIDETTQPPSYLGVLTQELRNAMKDWKSVPSHRQKPILEFAAGLSKPGLIIDGQHRVFGAKNVSEFDVTLPVVLIPDLPMAEQVFHFYVLNNKAVPLNKTALRGTVSTSLSQKEIGDLFERLADAGVDAAEAQWTRALHDKQASPFHRLVDFGLGGDESFLKENVLNQVVKSFMRPARKYRKLADGAPKWQEDSYRMSLFIALWNAVKEKYAAAWSEAVQNKGGQILEKAAMLVLQQFLLDDMVNDIPKRRRDKPEWSPFASAKELVKSVEGRLFYLPEDFFMKQWTETGLDTNEGRKFLLSQMEEAVSRQGERIGQLSLFRAKKGAKRS